MHDSIEICFNSIEIYDEVEADEFITYLHVYTVIVFVVLGQRDGIYGVVSDDIFEMHQVMACRVITGLFSQRLKISNGKHHIPDQHQILVKMTIHYNQFRHLRKICI